MKAFVLLHEVLGTALAATTVITAAVVAVADVPAGQSLVIMDDLRLRCFCIMGSVGGAVLSAMIFAPPQTTGRKFAVKIGTSSLAGILFTPALFRWMAMKPDLDMAMSGSAAVALLSVGLIRVGVPFVQKQILDRFGIKPPQDSDDQRP